MKRKPDFLSHLFAVAICAAGGHASATEPLTVYTVNYPLQYFAQRIAGEHAEVVYPGPADQDPAFWTPDLESIQIYQQADLILLNGAGYAKWTRSVSLPRSRLVDTSKAFGDQLIETQSAATHSHGPTGSHSHGGVAFTTWLDFKQAARQAGAIRAALVRRLPELEEAFTSNYNELEKELNEIDKEMRTVTAKKRALPIFASHPVYQYLARAYGLNLSTVTWEPDQKPDDKQWAALESLLDEHPATIMIWEAQPGETTESHLLAMGIRSVVFDPCAMPPKQGDFLSVMRDNLRRLDSSLHQ
jgi:zinc transport system substrate-binding protein